MTLNLNRLKFSGLPQFVVEVSTATLNGAHPVHSHDYTEINIFVSGTGTHIVCGREYLIGPGDVFVINPDATHGFAQAKNLFHYKVNYMRSALESISGRILQLPGYQALFILAASGGNEDKFPCRLRLSANDLRSMISLIKKLRGELNGGAPGCETLAQAYFMEISVGLARCYGREMEDKEEMGHIDKLALLASYLERHCLEPISSEDMGRIACLSERQMRRLFVKYYQTSPIDYLLRLRVQHAASLLFSTNKTVSEIAYACGFHENSYFCRQFRKYTEMSPIQYRKQSGNN